MEHSHQGRSEAPSLAGLGATYQGVPLQRAAVLLSFCRMLACPHLCSIFLDPAKSQSSSLPFWLHGKERFCYSQLTIFGALGCFPPFCFWWQSEGNMCSYFDQIRQTHSAAEERRKNIKEKALMTSPESPIIPNSAQKIEGEGRNLFLFRGCWNAVPWKCSGNRDHYSTRLARSCLFMPAVLPHSGQVDSVVSSMTIYIHQLLATSMSACFPRDTPFPLAEAGSSVNPHQKAWYSHKVRLIQR